jgi:hypothetical protein
MLSSTGVSSRRHLAAALLDQQRGEMRGDMDEKLSRPDSKAGRLQRECLALYREHESDGAIPTSGRFLFYELEDRRIVPKAYRKADGTPRPRTPAQDISDAVTHLREVGLRPWEDIVDETRTLDSWAYAGSVVEFLLKEVSFARIDVWDGEEPPLILCESRSLAGALWSIAAEYLCPIASTNGQAGGFLHTSVAPLVKGGRRVFYLGDHDLSGGHIEENTRRVLERYGELEWEKIAITDVQVREHGYEADAVMKKDRRYKPPRVFWAVETERLGQVPLMRLLRERLDAELSEPLAMFREREAQQRIPVREALVRLRLEDGTPEDRIPHEIVDQLESSAVAQMANVVSWMPGSLIPARRSWLFEQLKRRLAGRLLS